MKIFNTIGACIITIGGFYFLSIGDLEWGMLTFISALLIVVIIKIDDLKNDNT